MAAKRLTDTGKWDQLWFRKLSTKMKCAWLYICDQCDLAGVWQVDLETMSHFVGEEVAKDELFLWFGPRIIEVSSAEYIVRDFVSFQYGTLNSANRVHKAVLNRLSKIGIDDPNNSEISPIHKNLRALEGPKEKEKEKEKDKKKDKETDFFLILNSTIFNHLLLTHGPTIEKIESMLLDRVVFGEHIPAVFHNNSKSKMLATLVHVYLDVELFRSDLNAILAEKNTMEKDGPARSDYIATRVKNKALELYNANI